MGQKFRHETGWPDDRSPAGTVNTNSPATDADNDCPDLPNREIAVAIISRSAAPKDLPKPGPNLIGVNVLANSKAMLTPLPDEYRELKCAPGITRPEQSCPLVRSTAFVMP
jgi:hypothetical protein